MKGFTLIEVLVVVVIIGILAAVVVPRFMDEPDRARAVKARQDIEAITTALKMYRLDNRVYPSTNQGLQALVEAPRGQPEAPGWKAGGYIERLPADPWGRDYLYLNPGIHGEIDVWTHGANGQPGGEGVNAEIGNWSE
ncbi:MAG: type II secretion system major pseudopilin GspG [Wenzhouxiangellaceae bacterium]|nr:type II secretion system major pseudopilin GspG [Wenzhouxiangellaceae bacterium]